ncbi:MAG: hypothetical protein HKN41_08650, partial [Ilumatobacter sp.]|nr:hypothetical protein [Ilumatobacter sp.]
MSGRVDYAAIAEAIEPAGMIVRGGFVVNAHDDIPPVAVDRPTSSVVIVGNVAGPMWDRFERARTPGHDPLDRWTRQVLEPVAERFGARFLHPSDRPYQPFQHWAQRADAVWSSPIGLLVHREYGLWHAYRGALLFDAVVDGLPAIVDAASPCVTCVDQPCLTTCPVDAFSDSGYDHVACAGHVTSGHEPTCLTDGCAARRACPVGIGHEYVPDQM